MVLLPELPEPVTANKTATDALTVRDDAIAASVVRNGWCTCWNREHGVLTTNPNVNHGSTNRSNVAAAVTFGVQRLAIVVAVFW